MSSGHHHRHTNGPEHDFEPQHGLPEALPAGEHLLWQGAPDFRSLARRSFHVRKFALYFALMVLARAASDLASGVDLATAAMAMLKFGTLAAVGLGLVLGLAWLTARTTVYTLTDRRVVMRIGIVLSVSYNLPLLRIQAADLKPFAEGTGHLPLKLEAPNKIAYLHLWPHARPWQLARPQPMLLCVPDAARVAQLLSTAWTQVHGQALTAQPTAQPTQQPTPQPSPAHGNGGQLAPSH